MNKTKLSRYFNIAAVGSLICLLSSILDIILVFNESDRLYLLSDISIIIGALIWGYGLIGAGQGLYKAGYKETGVISAGGALIFWVVTLILFLIVVDQDNIEFDKLSFYIWYALTIIGPAIFYFSLKKEEGQEDKFFGMASNGMGIVIICDLILIGIILLGLWMADGGGVSVSTSGNFTIIHENKYHALGKWIFENYTLVMTILGIVTSLGYLLCTISMATYRDAIADLAIEPDINFSDSEGSALSANPENHEVNNEFANQEPLPEENHSKSSSLIKTGIFIAAGFLVATGIICMITSFCSQDKEFKELTVELTPPTIDPSNLGYVSELRLTGWRAIALECEDISLKTIDEISINLDFDKGNADSENGIPVTAYIIDESSNGADPLYGKGYLKDDRLTLFEAGKDFYEYYEEESGWLLLEADNIKNLAQFTATLHFSPEDEGFKYNLLDYLTWYKILDSTPTSVYEGPFGSKVSIQLIKPFGKDKGGIDALVFCYQIGIRDTEYSEDEELITSGWILSALDSDGYILLDANPSPYIGVAKWENDKLLVTRAGKTFEMNLTERMVFQNAEIEESIAEMEGWEGY